jgi:hypothetical protein
VPTNDAPVTPGQIRDSISILVRQIVIFARTVLLDSGSRAQIWWKDRRSSILATKAYFTERGPKTTARLTSSTQNRWPIFNLKSLFESWREVAGSLKSKWLQRQRGLSVRPRRVAAAFALALVLFSGFVLYWVATLPLNGGLQVEATQSALTFEGAQGEIFATRGVFKGDKLTAADLPAHLAQAIVAIEDRRFYQPNGVDFPEYYAPVGGIRRPAARGRAEYDNSAACTLDVSFARANISGKGPGGAPCDMAGRPTQEENILLRY